MVREYIRVLLFFSSYFQEGQPREDLQACYLHFLRTIFHGIKAHQSPPLFQVNLGRGLHRLPPSPTSKPRKVFLIK